MREKIYFVHIQFEGFGPDLKTFREGETIQDIFSRVSKPRDWPDETETVVQVRKKDNTAVANATFSYKPNHEETIIFSKKS